MRFMPGGFEALIELPLDIFPYSVAVGADDHCALYGTVVHKLSLYYHIGIPLGKICIDVGYLFDKIAVIVV